MLALNHHPAFDFGGSVKYALTSFVRGEKAVVKLPRYEDGFAFGTEPSTICFMLDDTEDKDVLDWISGIQRGYRTTAIKSVLRNMLDLPNVNVLKETALKESPPVQNHKKQTGSAKAKPAPATDVLPVRESGRTEPVKPGKDWDLFGEDTFFENY